MHSRAPIGRRRSPSPRNDKGAPPVVESALPVVRWHSARETVSGGKEPETEPTSKVVDEVVLPELYYPFLPAISPHADAVHRGTVEWSLRFGLLPNEKARRLFEVTGIGRLVARTHADSSLEDLSLLSDWHAWVLLQDDVRDESRIGRHPDELSALDHRFLDVLDGARPVRDDLPLTRALHDLRKRLQGCLRANALSESRMRRLVRAVGSYFEASLWEASNRSRGVVPDLDSYVRTRPLAGGAHHLTEITDIIEGRRLPMEVREHPKVRRLTDASHNVICWANDIISLDRELMRGEVNNLVVVLCQEHGSNLREAVDRAAGMHDAEVCDFVALEECLPRFGPEVDAHLGRYVASLRARMRGLWDWSLESGRYRREEKGAASGAAASATSGAWRR